MRRLKGVFIAGALFALVLLCLFGVTFISMLSESRTPPQLTRTQQLGEAKEVAVTTGLSSAVIRKGKTLRFWLTVRNRTADRISDVRLLEVDAPGYAYNFLCESRNSETSCWHPALNSPVPPGGASASGQHRADPKLIAAELEPGQSLTVWGELNASHEHATQTLAAILGWRSPQKLPSQVVVILGENAVESRRELGLRAGREFLKDFGLPLVLVALGLAYQWWEKKRDEIREAQDLKAQLQGTWNLMLPISHDYNIRFYVPLAGAIRLALERIERQSEEELKAPGGPLALEAAREAYFYLLLLWRRSREASSSIGGFYFKNRVGEELASACLKAFVEHYFGRTGDVLRHTSQIMNHFEFNETVDAFMSKLDGAPGVEPDVTAVFKRGWAEFQSWLGTPSCTAAEDYLRALLAILSYEANRPYEHWYGEETKWRIDARTKDTLLNLGRQMSAQADMEGFHAEVLSYLKPRPGS